MANLSIDQPNVSYSTVLAEDRHLCNEKSLLMHQGKQTCHLSLYVFFLPQCLHNLTCTAPQCLYCTNTFHYITTCSAFLKFHQRQSKQLFTPWRNFKSSGKSFIHKRMSVWWTTFFLINKALYKMSYITGIVTMMH